jgi:hypothetical protein
MAHAQETSSQTQPQGSRADDLRGEIDRLAEGGFKSSYGVAPNHWATSVAKDVVSELHPSRIIPMADGGIGLVFPAEGGRAARVNITNDEEIVITFNTSPDARPDYREVAPSEVVPLVSAFLHS